MKKSLALLFALVAVLVLVAPAAAVRPYIETFHFDGIDPAVVNCADYGDYDFVIDDHIVIDQRLTWYCDQGDTCTPENASKLHVHGQGVDNLYNANDDPENPDPVISGSFVWNYTEDLITSENRVTGAFWHVMLPGYGPIFFDAGQGYFDEEGYQPLFGNHQFDPILCEILSNE